MIDDSIQSAYHRVVEGQPSSEPVSGERSLEPHEPSSTTSRPARSPRSGTHGRPASAARGDAHEDDDSADRARSTNRPERITLDEVVERACTPGPNAADEPASATGSHERLSITEAGDAARNEVALLRAQARLAWSRVRVLEEALADAYVVQESLQAELDRARVDRDERDRSSDVEAAAERPAIPPASPDVTPPSDSSVRREPALDVVREELARRTEEHVRAMQENAHLRQTLRRAELALEDAQIIRRGLRDDLREWRRRALEAETLEPPMLTPSVPEADAWREAAALAQRVIEAEIRAAELADDAAATRRERDQLEAVVVALSEAVEARGEDAWARASLVGERIAERHEEMAETLAASERVNERLVRERDSAFDALTRVRARHEAIVEALRQGRRRRAKRRHRA
jgi:hypothetical protein